MPVINKTDAGPVVPLSGVSPGELKANAHTKFVHSTHSSVSQNSYKVETTQCPSMDEAGHKTWSLYTMECYSATKGAEH